MPTENKPAEIFDHSVTDPVQPAGGLPVIAAWEDSLHGEIYSAAFMEEIDNDPAARGCKPLYGAEVVSKQKALIDALQLRLNAADQRNDELMALIQRAAKLDIAGQYLDDEWYATLADLNPITDGPLTNEGTKAGDHIGALNEIVAEQPAHFTAVDIATADADGYKNGRQSAVVVLPEREMYTKYLSGVIPSNATEVSSFKDGWNACLEEARKLNAQQ